MYSDDIYELALQEVYHYLGINRFEQAKSKLSELLGVHPNNGELLYLMSSCLYNLNEFEESYNFCIEALKNNFSVELCKYHLGNIHSRLEQYIQAEECFLDVLQINPLNAEAIADYAELMIITGHHEKAGKLIQEALRLEPANYYVLHQALYYNLANNNLPEHMNILQQYLLNANDEFSKQINIGMSEWFRNNYKAAKENFRQAFLLNPTNQDILDVLEELDKQTHILFLPQRLFEKVGGPAVLWISVVIPVAVLRNTRFVNIAFIIAMAYITIAIYTWITPFLYKLFFRRK